MNLRRTNRCAPSGEAWPVKLRYPLRGAANSLEVLAYIEARAPQRAPPVVHAGVMMTTAVTLRNRQRP